MAEEPIIQEVPEKEVSDLLVVNTPTGKGLPNKETIKQIIDHSIDTQEPLKQYILVKFNEQIIKGILEDKEFRKRVKDDYLTQTKGVLDKTDMYGVIIGTTNQEKKVALAKVYTYSDEVDELEAKIDALKSEIKMNEQALKNRKLFEIDRNIAKEVTPDSILGQEVQKADEMSNILDNFNITITFKNK